LLEWRGAGVSREMGMTMFHIRSGIIWRGLDSAPQLKLRRGSVEKFKLKKQVPGGRLSEDIHSGFDLLTATIMYKQKHIQSAAFLFSLYPSPMS